MIDVERADNMAKEQERPLIDAVENMAGFACPRCDAVIELFGSGRGKKLADHCSVPFPGSIPIDVDARILGDKWKPIEIDKPNCEATNTFKSIVNFIEGHYQKELQAQVLT